MKYLFILVLGLWGLHETAIYPIKYSLNGKVGYKNAAGKDITGAIYDHGGDFKEGRALVVKSGKRGFLNTAGQVCIPLRYSDANSFSEGYAVAALSGKYGFIDTTGAVVISFLYERCTDFNGDLATVRSSGKWFLVNRKGKKISEGYEDMGSQSGGFISAKKDGRWGYLNASGKEILPFLYDQAGKFANGKAPVKIKLDYFFIDKNGNRVGQQHVPEDFKKYGLDKK